MKNNKNYKKVAMSSAVALGLAALPVGVVVAADATTSHTDTITITVGSTCTLGTITDGAYNGDDATTHANGSYILAGGDDAGGTWDGDTLSITMSPGTVGENIGQTTLTVRCNNAGGYKIIALANNGGQLKKAGSSAYIMNNNKFGEGAFNSISHEYATSYWSMMAESGASGLVIDEAYVAPNAAPGTTAGVIAAKESSGTLDGESLTITYGAGITTHQESGLYSGEITYTLVQLDSINDTDMNSGEETEGESTEGGGSEQGEGGGTQNGGGGGTVNGGTETGGTVENNEPIVNQAPSRQMMAMAPSNYSGGTGGDVATVGGNSKDEKGDAQGVSSASGKAKSAGNSTVKSTAVAGDTGADNTPLIAALCATAAAGAAAAGVYLYNKEKEEE